MVSSPPKMMSWYAIDLNLSLRNSLNGKIFDFLSLPAMRIDGARTPASVPRFSLVTSVNLYLVALSKPVTSRVSLSVACVALSVGASRICLCR